MKKARELVGKVFNLLMKPEMRILPGHLAFYLVMTIIPLLALLVTLAAALSISTETIRITLADTIPAEVLSVLDVIVAGNGINFNIVVFYFSAFLLASNGTYSMINISNEIYKVEPRDAISRRLKAILMIFILVGLFLFLIVVPVFGSTLFEIIRASTGSAGTVTFFQKMLIILKYPLILVVLYINIKAMYVIAPDRDVPSSSTKIGAAFTTIGWILATEIFAFYIERFARYDVFYGSISNVLVLLLWVYLLAYIYVFGMVINASEYKNEMKKEEKKELKKED
ncbi:MAG: YihY/virulence factor BrkB family protein [Bacilli bacterium]|nr:YihY/virulence factor BrkB family protein [Bacilli bacterium]